MDRHRRRTPGRSPPAPSWPAYAKRTDGMSVDDLSVALSCIDPAGPHDRTDRRSCLARPADPKPRARRPPTAVRAKGRPLERPTGTSREPIPRVRVSRGVSARPTDGDAIAASLAEPRAFGVIFERHFGAIHRYLRRRLDDRHAEEATAQTFLAAFDGRRRFDRTRPDARSWLFGIATNVAHNHRRREIRELRAIASLGSEESGANDGTEARVDAERMRIPLACCLAELPAEEADVLYLLVWAELDQAEIAAALGVPIGTVKSRLFRARKRVREALDLHDPDPTPTDLTPTRR